MVTGESDWNHAIFDFVDHPSASLRRSRALGRYEFARCVQLAGRMLDHAATLPKLGGARTEMRLARNLGSRDVAWHRAMHCLGFRCRPPKVRPAREPLRGLGRQAACMVTRPRRDTAPEVARGFEMAYRDMYPEEIVKRWPIHIPRFCPRMPCVCPVVHHRPFLP